MEQKPTPVVHLPGLPAVSGVRSDVDPYLAPTGFLDFEAPNVRRFVAEAIGDARDLRVRA